jgi:hypothetical protein
MSDAVNPVVDAAVAPTVPPTNDAVAKAAADAAAVATLATEPAKDAAAPVVEQKVSTGETPKDAKPVEAKVVPEKYDLKLPDNAVLDPSLLQKIAAVAKERGMSQEQAQGFVNAQNKEVQEIFNRQSEAWLEQVKGDKELGGEGANQTVELAKRVVDRFGTESLKTDLNRTGYGNHPELVRLLSRIGKSMSEDQFVRASAQSTGGKKSDEEIFYGSSTSQTGDK